jgi:hypothetical protein
MFPWQIESLLDASEATKMISTCGTASFYFREVLYAKTVKQLAAGTFVGLGFILRLTFLTRTQACRSSGESHGEALCTV